MCGIAGIFDIHGSSSISEELLRRMISALQHRGPDESGMYVDRHHVGLAHTRLSIIGLDDGTQPISNENETLWIVYNGEAFNYPELKKDLVEKGHIFKTNTDTEVVLHLYEEHGAQCLERINGQFAFAIWDTLKKELFLARDRMGIRPLFYCNTNGRFSFASEIKALFSDERIHREIDPTALFQIFHCWTTLTPATAFKNIFELPAGHWMTVNENGITLERYWQVPYADKDDLWDGTYNEAVDHLRYLIEDAVRLRLRADVPVGAYLSGGLDSSYITAMATSKFNNRLRTFSLSFEESAFDERKYQNQMVDFLNSSHTSLSIQNTDVHYNFPKVIWHCERPLMRTAPVPLYLLSRCVRDSQFKVVLTGEGADEVFLGYNIFKEGKVRQFWGKRPESKLRPMLIEKLYPYIFKNPSRNRHFLYKFYSVTKEDLNNPFFSHWIRWKNSGKNTNFFSNDLLSATDGYQLTDDILPSLPSDFSSRDVLSRAQYLEMDIFLSNYLLSSQGDRVAMAHSMEIRLPFLDYRIVEFASRLPAHWKLNGLNEKYILKQAAENLIPKEIMNRTKQPYRAPVLESFADPKKDDYAEELLSEKKIEEYGYFNSKKVKGLTTRIKNTDPRRISETQHMAYIGILSTQLIHQQFIDNFPTFSSNNVIPQKIIRDS